jgi:EAL domain-containing protein (putative c-di-GMP-specific phosphodiesterase class I)
LIPHVEHNGDIGPLTRWILLEACQQACSWSPSIQLGVNCTINQLRRGEVSNAVASALEQTGFRSGQLTLEVTEDAIVDPSASADLKHLSQMGVQLSVDDAGTNWSSFEPLKRHSISTVKIDGSFIAGLEPSQGINRLVVETVIHMAHSLGMSAIVEAVETPTQVEIVRSFNADAAQGFFFARPMSGENALTLAGSSDVPQFSRTEIRTWVRSGEAQVGKVGGPEETGGSEVEGSTAAGESTETVETVGTFDSVDSVGSAESVDSVGTPDATESVDIGSDRTEQELSGAED